MTGLESLVLLLALLSLVHQQRDFAAVLVLWSAGWVAAGSAAEMLS